MDCCVFYVIFPSLLPLIVCAIAMHADRQNGLLLLLLLVLLLLFRRCSYKVHIFFCQFHLKCWGRCEACEIHSVCQWIEASIENKHVRCSPIAVTMPFDFYSMQHITHATHKSQITFNDTFFFHVFGGIFRCIYVIFHRFEWIVFGSHNKIQLNNSQWYARLPFVYTPVDSQHRRKQPPSHLSHMTENVV